MTTVPRGLSVSAYRGLAGSAFENPPPVSLVVSAISSVESLMRETSGLFLRPGDSIQWVNGVRHRSPDHLATRSSPACLSRTRHPRARSKASRNPRLPAPAGKDPRR